jgi:hypothetical protein
MTDDFEDHCWKDIATREVLRDFRAQARPFLLVSVQPVVASPAGRSLAECVERSSSPRCASRISSR